MQVCSKRGCLVGMLGMLLCNLPLSVFQDKLLIHSRISWNKDVIRQKLEQNYNMVGLQRVTIQQAESLKQKAPEVPIYTGVQCSFQTIFGTILSLSPVFFKQLVLVTISNHLITTCEMLKLTVIFVTKTSQSLI